MEFDDFDEDDEFYSPPPHPDDRLWRHPAEVAAEARNAAPFAGHEEPPLLARVASRWPLALAAVGAGVVFTMVGVSQLFAPGAGVAQLDHANPVDPTTSIATAPLGSAGSEAAWDRNLRSIVEPALPMVEVVRGTEKAIGRGIFIAEAGYVMTSARLVDDADMLLIRTNSNDRYVAEFIGADPLTDVAVVRISNAPASDHDHPIAPINNTSQLRIGQPLLAIANDDPSAVAVARVTGTANAVSLAGGQLSYGFVQVDLAPGMVDPGAAVFDELGTAVGMVPSMSSANARASMVPIDIAHSVATSLISGDFDPPWLGVGVNLASTPGRISGSLVQITEIYAEGPALQHGLEIDDRVVSVAGKSIGTISDLLHAVWGHEPGESVEIGLLRGEEHELVTITLGARPYEATAADQ